MENLTLLQFRDHDLDLGASSTAYAEALTEQGLPETHEQLLHELLQWVDPNADSRVPIGNTIQRVLDIENEILMDASVTAAAAEHVPFLYTVLARVFNAGPAFQHMMHRAAQDAEQEHEDTIHQHMRETGCDRLEAVQLMATTAPPRLQERQEKVLYAVEVSLEQNTDAGQDR